MDVRRSRFLTSAAANWAALAVSLAVTFLLTPYLMARLGPARYGVWCVVEAVLAYLTVLDLGVGVCLVRAVARGTATGDRAGVGRTASVEDDLVTLARRCAAFWAAAGGLLTLRAVARLRGDRLFAAPAAGTVGGKPKPVPRRPPVPDRAVAWWTEYGHLTAAQMRVIGGINGWSYVRWLLWSLAVLGGCRWWAHVYPDRWPFLGKLADIASPALLVMWAAIFVLVPLFLAAQVIAKERVADTLQSLTLTALSARDIVAQKWRGVLRPLRHTWVVGACWAVAAVATGGIPWWAALLFLTITPLVAPCWAAIGLGFSAHASTPAKAGRNLSAVVFGGGYGLGIVVSVLLSFIPDRTAKAVVGGGVAVLAVLAQPLLAWLAFRYAVRRLEREYD